MSRVGKKPILIPEKVEVKIDGSLVTVKGPKGELKLDVLPEIKNKRVLTFAYDTGERYLSVEGLF